MTNTLRLLAFVDWPGAREALGDNPCRCVHYPCRSDCMGKQDMPLPDRIAALVPLIEAACTVACERLRVDGFHATTPLSQCELCDHGCKPDPHALLRACVAVAWACWRTEADKIRWHRPGSPAHKKSLGIHGAIHAAEAYMAEPTTERLEAWSVAWSAASCNRWLPEPCVDKRERLAEIQEAANLISLDTVLRVVAEASTRECPECVEADEQRAPRGYGCCSGTGRVAL